MRATAAHALVSLAALGGTGPPVTETAGKASGAARSKGGKGSNQRSKGPSASASGQGKSKGDAVCASAVAGILEIITKKLYIWIVHYVGYQIPRIGADTFISDPPFR